MGLALTPLLIALLLPGCAVINPNVTLKHPRSATIKPQDPKAENLQEPNAEKPQDTNSKENPEETKHYTLSQGIRYAEDAIKEYDYFISSNNWFRGTIGVLMIGASAAALALGITDGGTTAITALGVSGASLFGIGTFLTESSRNTIYNEGKEKVICAIAAVQPLFLSTERVKEFRQTLPKVITEIGNVQIDIQKVNEEMPSVDSTDQPGKERIKRGQDMIASAKKTIKAGEGAYEAGTALDLQLSRAGNALITAVDGINVEVNKRVAGTVSSLEAANTIIGGLATISTRLTPIPKEAKDQAKAALEVDSTQRLVGTEDEFSNALNDLIKSNERLAGEVASVATIVAEVEPSLGNLSQCKLNLQELTLSVKPQSIEFEKGTAGTRRLIILTGKKPFAAQLLEQPVNGLTVEQPVPFGSTVEMRYDGADIGDKFTVHIVDGAERHVFVTVEVKDVVKETKSDKVEGTQGPSPLNPNDSKESPQP